MNCAAIERETVQPCGQVRGYLADMDLGGSWTVTVYWRKAPGEPRREVATKRYGVGRLMFPSREAVESWGKTWLVPLEQ